MMKRSALFILILFMAGLSACVKTNDVTLTLPTVVGNDVIIDATATSAYSGGFLTSGTSIYTAYGICYSATNPEPTIADSKTTEAINQFWFTSNLTGLSPNTTYYARAYATNSVGTGYGSVIKFATGSDISATYGQVSTLAGSLSSGFTNGNLAVATFNNPMGVAVDAAGDIYVADSFNSAIRKIDADGTVSTIAGTGSLGYQNGAAAQAQFYAPSALVVDASGNIYVADRGNNTIRKITPGGIVSTLAGNGTAGYADGTGTDATFNTPAGITLDAAGNIYVADQGNNLVRKVTPAGVVTTIAGNRTAGYLNGAGTDANLNKPTGIALDVAGNIYVTEPLNYAIRKIDANYLVTTFAGGPGIPVLLGSPNAINTDVAGNFWITDSNGRILKINAAKTLSIMAGTSGTTGSTDGAGNTALFSNPTGIAADTKGNVYVADFGNNLIRKIR